MNEFVGVGAVGVSSASMGPDLELRTRLAYTVQEAAALINVDPRWFDDGPVERVDLRKPGASRPVWRIEHETLLAYLRGRRVQAGHPSTHGQA